MRTRDEVLREFPNAQRVLTGERTVWRDKLAPEIKRMADRIRELEERVEELSLNRMADEDTKELGEFLSQFDLQGTPAPVAASEPVAWAIVNRDGVTMDVRMTVTEAREHSIGGDTLRPLVFGDVAHPSAAAVTVTEAMVEAAWKELRVQCVPDGPSLVDCVDREDLRSALTAALQTAASEGESDAAVAPCEWRLDDPDFHLYHTDCGNDFELNEDGPVENRMAFCCYCGKPMKAKRTRPTTPTRGSDE